MVRPPISPTGRRRNPSALSNYAPVIGNGNWSARSTAALGRIEEGSYGYCDDTGEPIGLKRLEARPIATLSIEAQERHERRERVYRDE